MSSLTVKFVQISTNSQVWPQWCAWITWWISFKVQGGTALSLSFGCVGCHFNLVVSPTLQTWELTTVDHRTQGEVYEMTDDSATDDSVPVALEMGYLLLPQLQLTPTFIIPLEVWVLQEGGYNWNQVWLCIQTCPIIKSCKEWQCMYEVM